MKTEEPSKGETQLAIHFSAKKATTAVAHFAQPTTTPAGGLGMEFHSGNPSLMVTANLTRREKKGELLERQRAENTIGTTTSF